MKGPATRIAGLLLAAAALAACSRPGDGRLGVYMLLDTSGTYTRELDQAQKIINATLVRLNPGDSFAVARIDTGSFSEKDIIQKVTLDDRPSRANQQKRSFQEQVDRFVRPASPISAAACCRPSSTSTRNSRHRRWC